MKTHIAIAQHVYDATALFGRYIMFVTAICCSVVGSILCYEGVMNMFPVETTSDISILLGVLLIVGSWVLYWITVLCKELAFIIGIL